MPLPTTLEAYAVRRMHKLEKKVEEKDNLIYALNEKVLKLSAIIEQMGPRMSDSGGYVTFRDSYPNVDTAAYRYLVELGFLPVQGPGPDDIMPSDTGV